MLNKTVRSRELAERSTEKGINEMEKCLNLRIWE